MERSQKKTVEFLKTINSVDDLKAHKDEVLDLIEDLFKAGLLTLKTYFESAVSPEDKQKAIARFQDEHFIFSEEMEQEMTRIDELPGATECFESFQDELDIRIEPFVNEFGEQMKKIMEDFMGDMMGGVMNGLGEMMGGIMNGFGEMMGETNSEFDRENDDGKLDVGQIIYKIQSLEDLKKNKDRLIEEIDDQLNFDLEALKHHKNINLPNDNLIQAGQKRIDRRQVILERDIEIEFKRIAALPDALEYAELAKKELMDRIEPKVKEIKKLLKESKKIPNPKSQP